MSTLVGTGSIDSSNNSYVEIDSGDNSQSSHEQILNTVAEEEEDEDEEEEIDTKPNFNHLLSPVTSAHAAASVSEQFLKNNFTAMGGISIPHHGLSAAFHGYHSSSSSSHYHPSHHHHQSSSSSNNNNHHNNSTNNNHHNSSSRKTPPFLLPAQLYKSLFASAVLQNPDKLNATPFPRNLLFSCSEKSPTSSENGIGSGGGVGNDIDEKCSISETEVKHVCICNEDFNFFYSF